MRELMRSLHKVSSDDELFRLIENSFTEKITRWNYFVDWDKVHKNITPIEKELNLLNTIIGKDDVKKELFNLILEYPKVIKAFPILLASRDKSIEVLIDLENKTYKNYNFLDKNPTPLEAQNFIEFVCKSGFLEIVQNKKLKNFVDYVLGVEVGLDSNGRKNRIGKQMESIVEDYLISMNVDYMPQAEIAKINEKWNKTIQRDKSKRIIDFAVQHKGKLFFIEVNFYSGNGSKLKSTANEYIKMNSFWKEQDVTFLWITDGLGWKSTLNSLREYFDSSEYLLNLDMLHKGILEKVILYE